MDPSPLEITDEHLHSHLRTRMEQRGVSREEVEQTVNDGWEAEDAKPGTQGKTFVFSYRAEWEGAFYTEKEVTVYFKHDAEQNLVLLTVIARYGENFPRQETP